MGYQVFGLNEAASAGEQVGKRRLGRAGWVEHISNRLCLDFKHSIGWVSGTKQRGLSAMVAY